MHNIKNIRNNFEDFKNKIKSRNLDINFDEILDLDKLNRNFIQKKENLEKEKKDISKSQDKSLFEKSKKISSFHSKLWFWPFLAGGLFGFGYSITKKIFISKFFPELSIQQNSNKSEEVKEFPDFRSFSNDNNKD